MRLTATFTVLAAGMALALLGFFLAAPIGPTVDPSISNPRLVFAPGLFVLGVVLLFGSAIVFELIPDRDGD